ncbi:MAG: HNH endonuclease [Rikenellaceae bacterium]|nr:HNH endonuclease [Rikenellaceae bacterium]
MFENGYCYICRELIDLRLHGTNVNIDHIISLIHKGKDLEENFALTHESCNKSKQDADLKIARILFSVK